MFSGNCSSMKFIQFGLALVLIIFCLQAATSYKIVDRPLKAFDRDQRAVTEWRFRRNFFLHFPKFFSKINADDRLAHDEEQELTDDLRFENNANKPFPNDQMNK